MKRIIVLLFILFSMYGCTNIPYQSRDFFVKLESSSNFVCLIQKNESDFILVKNTSVVFVEKYIPDSIMIECTAFGCPVYILVYNDTGELINTCVPNNIHKNIKIPFAKFYSGW